ncbi:hypothetical protein FH972_021868 [Carpinus fangiana]|uniref:RGS domain-containing protein n=1 Tax=Carpinus fangiana TaxID=176857 RepID=A0A5N6KQY2_9ROSI|nr:hypothetical protein FH972_021868 [Carpinus fangiana]
MAYQHDHQSPANDRLPTLNEVLSRQTAAPVDLFSFYIYMRDQQRSVDYLDFWLDVHQHMSLCRHFVAELRRSVLYETPELEKTVSKASSAILETFHTPEGTVADRTASLHSSPEKTVDQRVSAFLRTENNGKAHSHKDSSSSSNPSRSRPGTAGHTSQPSNGTQLPRPSFMASNLDGSPNDSSGGQESSPDQHTVTRQDIRASAEKILYTYLLEGAEREIILPPSILNDIVQAIEEEGRDDPEVFDASKEYVFQAMERDAFPGFLRSKALGNLVPPSLLLRVVVGLLAMFGGFWAAFVLIFLDKDRATRCWIILPFLIGVYLLATHQYTLDPILAFVGYSEYTFFNFSKMGEPFVRTLLRKRALIVSGWIAIITTALETGASPMLVLPSTTHGICRLPHVSGAVRYPLFCTQMQLPRLYLAPSTSRATSRHDVEAMASAQKPKRGPTVLVTDSRDNLQKNAKGRPSLLQRAPTTRKLISVDNVLQYASEIPSGQPRGPPGRPGHQRTPSGRHPLDPKLSGRMAQQQLPTRSSKVLEKLVLLPEAEGLEDEEKGDFEDDEDIGPPTDEDRKRAQRVPTGLKEKSYAERMSKASRADKLSRVTAYCTAQAYRMRATADFVREKHGAKTKLYDDCLYTVYHLPLLPGIEGYRIRSSPVLKSPGGKAVLDEEIERNERHEYREGFFGEEQFGVRGSRGDEDSTSPHSERSSQVLDEGSPYSRPDDALTPFDSNTSKRSSSPPPLAAQLASSLNTFAEMFIFSYGVVVFWNFTERQEKDILADLTFSAAVVAPTIVPGSKPPGLPASLPLAVRPLRQEDFETEEFHFEYNPAIPRPRVFNDMITLRSGDHMIKLAMSHAIAQSTKLSFFEERMADTMAEAQSIPRRLALTGDLGMKREENVRILGRLYMTRVDVNLSSNMLDVPKFFWDSEPTLNPLYSAVREYLEISPRIQMLNERCKVFLDLASILSEAIGDKKMSQVFLRFALINAGKGKEEPGAGAIGTLPGRLSIGQGEL